MQRLFTCLTIALLTLLLFANIKPASGQERRYEVSGCQGQESPQRFCPHGGQQPPLEIVEVRNIQSEHWMRDLEIEVKNISSKPIYRISFGLGLPDIGGEGSHYGFSLKYGESGPWFADDLANPDDPSLKPGETYVFRIPKALWKGFENYMKRMNFPDTVTKRVVFRLDAVNFGDGTGFEAGRYVGRSRR